MNEQELKEKIAELSRYRDSAQQVVDNYKKQIEALEEQRAELMDAKFSK